MRIALGLPSRVAAATGELMFEWITRAERGPFSSLVVTDRVVSQALEPLSVLAMAAGATKRIGLMTSVVIGPTRETTLLARQAATIDVLSNGRLHAGCRHRRAQERLSGHRRKFSSARPALGRTIRPASPSVGRRSVVDEVGAIGPASPRSGGPEMLIGGYVPAIAQRIGKWGDGYMAPGGGEPEAMQKMWRNVLQAWKENNRQGQPRWVGASYFALGPDAQDHATKYISHNYGYNPELAAKRLRSLPASREAVEESIKRQADMGVDEFILRPCAEDLDQMERLAEVAGR